MFQKYYPDPESARDAVRDGDAWGTLYFTENFTDALVARMALGREADEETLDQSEIRVWLDMSSKFSSHQNNMQHYSCFKSYILYQCEFSINHNSLEYIASEIQNEKYSQPETFAYRSISPNFKT